MIRALLALVAAALFAGGALYVSLVEHPARTKLDDQAALAQWKASYARAVPLMAGLAFLSLLVGLWAWWKTGDKWLLGAALLIGAAVPFTLLAVMPVNRRLQATAIGAGGADTRSLLARWGRLHAVRTALGVAAVAAYLTAFAWP